MNEEEGELAAVNAKRTHPISTGKTNWKKLHRGDDSDIDYRDNPSTDEKFWESDEVVMLTHKTHLSVRFDIVKTPPNFGTRGLGVASFIMQ